MTTLIHVYCPEEAVDTWFGVPAEHLRDDVYRILGPFPDDPILEYGVGDVVQCGMRPLATGIHFADELTADARVIDPSDQPG